MRNYKRTEGAKYWAVQAIIQAMGTVPTQVNGMDKFPPEDQELIKKIAKDICTEMMEEKFGIEPARIEQFWGL